MYKVVSLFLLVFATLQAISTSSICAVSPSDSIFPSRIWDLESRGRGRGTSIWDLMSHQPLPSPSPTFPPAPNSILPL
uniref:Secreted protein n=1 Tax=Arundo donax TaxID=35708 RepID=A0A0A9A0J0_ARUDO